MASAGQLTGMRGVYLVAAELAKRGFIASPTSRSAMGADILVTDHACSQAFSLQVKTNARTFDFWLLNSHATVMVSPTHLYVLVNIRQRAGADDIEYFVVPSGVVAQHTKHSQSKSGDWYSLYRVDIQDYQDRWELLGAPSAAAV